MEERDFAKYAFLIVVVVAVVGLLVGGSVDITGFAAKKTPRLQEGATCNAHTQCVSNLRCVQRVCQRLTCSDSDAANDPTVQGVATITGSVSGLQVTRSDKCERG